MESHHFMLKVSRLFPSSLTFCQFRTIPDVAESSITITKTNKKRDHHLHENDHSNSFFNNKPPKPQNMPKIKPSKLCKRNLILGHSSDAEGRKCPPVTPISNLNPKKKDKKFQEYCVRKNYAALVSINHSSSSNSGWFSSTSDEKLRTDRVDDGETDTFFSLSSNSGDSFRLKTSRRFRRCDEMKSIDEMGRCSFSSSVNSFDTVLSKTSCRKSKTSTTSATKMASKEGKKKSSGKPSPDELFELGFGQISTQRYYNLKNSTGSAGESFRRRKTAKNRRKMKRNLSSRSFRMFGSMIEESYAVEKSSSDPRSDFRASMVEMIVERQMFGAEDLERLLLCFLSLNEVCYHGIIFDVFSEICETLFSN